jgi:hypothetical protein
MLATKTFARELNPIDPFDASQCRCASFRTLAVKVLKTAVRRMGPTILFERKLRSKSF